MKFRIGDYELDEALFELRLRGQPVPVRRRVLETIFYLVRHRDRLVTREELAAGPWAGSAVSDAAIAQVIKQARDVLGDRGDGQKVIRTVRGKGVRFVAQVEDREDESPPTMSEPPDGTPASDVPRSVYVGRKRELARLREALGAAVGGAGQVILLGGNPGIGKTALVEQLAFEGRGRAVQVHWGRGWEAGGTPAFWPWLELLRAVVDSPPFAKLGSPPEGSTRWLDFVPELRRKVLSAQVPIEPPAESEHARVRVFDSITRFLTWVGASVDMLLVLEDLHSADMDSMALLRYAAPRLRSSRVLVLATYRPDELRARGLAVGDLPGAEPLLLDGLGADEVRELATAAAGGPLEAGALAQIEELSLGNPLMVRQLATSPAPVARDATEDAEESAVPRWWRARLDSHVARLPWSTGQLLQVAAIVGRGFGLGLVATISGLQHREALALLRPAIAQHVVQEDSSAPGAYQFIHVLFRDAIDRRLTPEERSDLHARCVAALEREGPLDDDHVYRLAHHSWMASTAERGAEGRKWALEAARRARFACAHEAECEQLAHAIALSDQGASSSPVTLDLVLRLGRAQRLAGRRAEAVASLEKAASMARASGDGVRFGEAVIGRFDVVADAAPIDTGLQQQVSDALVQYEEETPQRAILLAIQAFSRLFFKAFGDGRALWSDALRMARSSGDPLAVARVLMIGYRFCEDGRDLLSIANEAVAAAERANNFDLLIEGYFARCWACMQLGRLTDWKAQAAEHQRFATRLRHPTHMYLSTMMSMTPLLFAGNVSAAYDAAHAGYEMGLALGDPVAGPWLGCCLLSIYRADETRDGTEALLAEIHAIATKTLELAPAFVAWRIIKMNIEIERGDTNVDAVFRSLVGPKGYLENRDANYLPALMELTRAALVVGQTRDAEILYEQLLPYAGLHAAPMIGYWGPVHHSLAFLRRAVGDHDGEKRHLESALADAQRVECRPWIERVQRDLAGSVSPRSTQPR